MEKIQKEAIHKIYSKKISSLEEEGILEILR
jgi:hypothetical protein